jgi:hypothetical protein
VREVRRQVALGVAPAAGAHHPDLAAAQRVTQRAEHAQLVRDPLDMALLVDDDLAPGGRDDALERTPLRSVGSFELGAVRAPL